MDGEWALWIYWTGCVVAWVLTARVLDGNNWLRSDWEEPYTWDYYLVVGLMSLCAAFMWPLVLSILLLIGVTKLVSSGRDRW